MELLTISDLATLLKVSERTISELMNKRTRSGDLRENPLPCIRVGRSVRFKKEVIEGWLERCQNA